MEPKFKISDLVLVYQKGKLVEKLINRLQIIHSKERVEISYQFDVNYPNGATWLNSLFRDHWTSEAEVFASIDDFVEMQREEKTKI